MGHARFALVCAALAGGLAQLVYHGGPPGVDLPSHLFQTWLYSHAGFNLWNNYWYAGRYEFVTYSVLYYPVASAIGQALATTIAAAVLAGSFASVSRREWGSAATGPSLSFAATAPIILMIGGLYPFLAGAAAGGAALVCIHRRWRVGFGLAVARVARASRRSPSRSSWRCSPPRSSASRGRARALRRHRAAFAAVVAVFVVAVLMERAFPSGAWYPYDLTDAAIVFGFSLAGLYITGTSPRARSLRMLFACYLALNLVAFLLKGPIGSNSSRLFVIAGAPLLWLAANVSRERSRLVVLPAARGGARAPGRAVRSRRLLVVGRPGQRGRLLEARRASARDPCRPGAPRRGRRHPRPLGGVLPRQARHPAGTGLVPPGRLPAERAALLRQPDGPHVPPLAALARRPLRPAARTPSSTTAPPPRRRSCAPARPASSRSRTPSTGRCSRSGTRPPS